MKRDIYMVQCNFAGSVFVKTLDFFRKQGGFIEEWGLAWKPIVATSIEDARKLGCDLFPNARPYGRQAS